MTKPPGMTQTGEQQQRKKETQSQSDNNAPTYVSGGEKPRKNGELSGG